MAGDKSSRHLAMSLVVLLSNSACFLGAMAAFAYLYGELARSAPGTQAFISSGSGLNTLGFATPTTTIFPLQIHRVGCCL